MVIMRGSAVTSDILIQVGAQLDNTGLVKSSVDKRYMQTKVTHAMRSVV